MRIGCDVCRTETAAVICCADEAALCTRCDEEVHAANILAGKHRRLPLHCDASKIPRCDICQDKSAFIFCVEDRALFCQDCDEAIHIPGTLSANHRRLLATGISVGLISAQNTDSVKPQSDSPNNNSMASKLTAKKQAPSAPAPAAWAVDDFLQFSDYESGYKDSSDGLEELSWFADFSFSPEGGGAGSLASAAQVPEMLRATNEEQNLYRPPKSSMPYKKPRLEMLEDDDFFTVPDLG
ncbi:Salt tolerance protein [Platanthera guangdongensis]|uniref:Salt tolerance protein n=1 Tax=Platanthera guangdongensis TaxID=2320717 RepID=A0ABR2MAK7_9ASPA